MRSSLLLLADARLPAGGHAHSGGVEAAVAAGLIHDLTTVEAFLRGRLATAGLVAAAFAAATTAGPDRVAALDPGLDARIASPALRRASRAQGRAYLRAGRALWTVPALPAPDLHHPIAIGVVAAAAGLAPVDAALVAAYGTISGPLSAAIRLLGLDPYPAHAVLAGLGSTCDQIAADAAALADRPVEDLPALAAPMLDILAENHSTWEVRLFAS
jgi:urease accessory protein